MGAHNGVMVACYLPSRVARQVALADGEPAADLHVTLAYCKGLEPNQVATLHRAVLGVAKGAGGPIAARLGGVGRFFASETSDGKDVHHATVDSAELTALRSALVAQLEAAGVPVSKAHGFSPHVTLAYLDPSAPSPAAFAPADLRFDHLHVVQNGARICYPLGAFKVPAAPSMKRVLTTKVRKDAEGAQERYVLGIVLEPDVVDTQGETYNAEEVRKACHWWMAFGRKTDRQHSRDTLSDSAAHVLENWIERTGFREGDVDVKPGTWLQAWRVLDDSLWTAVQNGDVTGFSIDGDADKYIRR